MAVREKRQIRIEDWHGNVYLPEGTGGSGTGGGTIVDSDNIGTDPNNPPYTEGQPTVDPEANGGSAIVITSGNTRKMMFVTNFYNVPFGNIAMNIRIKSSMAGSRTELLEVNTYFVDASSTEPIKIPLDSKRFRADDFPKANEYTNLSMITNYKGTATGSYYLRVEIVVLPDTGATFYFDHLILALEMIGGAGFKYNIYVEGTTIIVDTPDSSQDGNIYVEGTTVIVPKV